MLNTKLLHNFLIYLLLLRQFLAIFRELVVFSIHVACMLAYLVTVCMLGAWSWVLFEKLPGSQQVKKFPAFYGTRRFITAFTTARHLPLSWTNSFQSMPSHPTSWRSTILLSIHLRLGLPSGLFPSGLPTKTLCALLLFTIRATCYAHLILLDLITRTIMDEEYRSLSSLIMFFSPFPCYFVPLELKYSPQHLILKHLQPTFLLQYEWPSLTPIHNRQNYRSSSLHTWL